MLGSTARAEQVARSNVKHTASEREVVNFAALLFLASYSQVDLWVSVDSDALERIVARDPAAFHFGPTNKRSTVAVHSSEIQSLTERHNLQLPGCSFL
jgi:hypothetical protein